MPAERLDRSLLRGRASRGPPVCPRGRGLINEARDPVAKDRPAWRTSAQQRDSYGSSDSGGAERLSSGCSGLASRISVASNSVTTVTPATGSSITSTTTVSTTGVLGGFIALTFLRDFFAPRLSLALAKLFFGIAFPTTRFAGLRACELYGPLSIFLFRAVGRFFR
jgi:hypothetical protein